MTGRSDSAKVKLLPKVLADVIPILQWAIKLRMQLIEEVACGFQVSPTGAPSLEEAEQDILQSLGRDWKADENVVVDYMRAEVREWWQDFPERRLLNDLYRRAALRRAECGSPDSRRRPSHCEGLRIAKPMLDDVPDRGQFDFKWESDAVSKVLAALWVPPLGVSCQTPRGMYQ